MTKQTKYNEYKDDSCKLELVYRTFTDHRTVSNFALPDGRMVIINKEEGTFKIIN